MYICSPPKNYLWAKNCLSHGPTGNGKIPSISMNIGNGTVVNIRLRINMIMADTVVLLTEINMNMRISSSMNVSSNMHIDTHTIIKVGISNASTKYEQKY